MFSIIQSFDEAGDLKDQLLAASAVMHAAQQLQQGITESPAGPACNMHAQKQQPCSVESNTPEHDLPRSIAARRAGFIGGAFCSNTPQLVCVMS